MKYSGFIAALLVYFACREEEEKVLPRFTPPDSVLLQDSADATEPPDEERVPVIIFDTDISADCDDAGALAVLHALENRNEVTILGMMVSMPVEYGAPAVDAINTYYKKPDIPIGTLKQSRDGAGTGGLLTYNDEIAAGFPNDLQHASHAPDATALYRQLLSAAADTSVTILTVGPLTNLFHLMLSEGDSTSPLDGIELINKKVKRLVTAGGSLPYGTSYNFWITPEKSEYVINNWPTEYWFVPNELGDDVLTGKEFVAQTSEENPVRLAYTLYRELHPDWPFRPSWDQMGVLVAVRGEGDLFTVTTGGSVTAKGDKIEWSATSGKNHVWFRAASSVSERKNVVDELMLQQPTSANEWRK